MWLKKHNPNNNDKLWSEIVDIFLEENKEKVLPSEFLGVGDRDLSFGKKDLSFARTGSKLSVSV